MATTNEALPAVGDAAPDFSVSDQDGNRANLKDCAGKAVVLYFYPKDSTPGCTIEAKEFRDALPDFEAAGALVFGVSPDNAQSHCKFIDKHGLGFRLLCDSDHEVATAYGVWTQKSLFGKKYMGIQRATFLIDPNGKIAQVWPKVKPRGHAAEVLAKVHEIT